MPVHNVAHRGYSAIAPENTLPALAAAVLAGATFVEFDVRTTADGVPMVIHDRTVDRTTDGRGAVWELTFDELRALDAGSWFSPAYAETRVPLLGEVLDLLRPHAAPADVLRRVATSIARSRQSPALDVSEVWDLTPAIVPTFGSRNPMFAACQLAAASVVAKTPSSAVPT